LWEQQLLKKKWNSSCDQRNNNCSKEWNNAYTKRNDGCDRINGKGTASLTIRKQQLGLKECQPFYNGIVVVTKGTTTVQK